MYSEWNNQSITNGTGKFMVKSPYQGPQCKTLAQNPYSRVISALDWASSESG